jgi:hypothetical protein
LKADSSRLPITLYHVSSSSFTGAPVLNLLQADFGGPSSLPPVLAPALHSRSVAISGLTPSAKVSPAVIACSSCRLSHHSSWEVVDHVRHCASASSTPLVAARG